MKVEHFFCYSKKVSDYLHSKGIPLVTVATDPKTKRTFSLYVIDDKLQEALDQYNSIR